jgi:hypothetical protein
MVLKNNQQERAKKRMASFMMMVEYQVSFVAWAIT